MLCFTLQRYKIESNSQRPPNCPPNCPCCVSHCKDTKLKAIHNARFYNWNTFSVVFHTAKIQNWKQFTTTCNSCNVWSCCVSHCKDTKLKAIHNKFNTCTLNQIVVFHTAKIQNWKQFTTEIVGISISERLCFTLQRYKIESNSQLIRRYMVLQVRCVSHCKDTKLKAIHNFLSSSDIFS